MTCELEGGQKTFLAHPAKHENGHIGRQTDLVRLKTDLYGGELGGSLSRKIGSFGGASDLSVTAKNIYVRFMSVRYPPNEILPDGPVRSTHTVGIGKFGSLRVPVGIRK